VSPDGRPPRFDYEAKLRFFKLVGYDPWEIDVETGALLTDAQFREALAQGRPTLGQKSFHWACCFFRFVSWFAGARSGKSIAGAMELAFRLFLPERRIWIAAPNYDLGSKEFEYVWKTYKEELPKRGLVMNYLPGTTFNPDRGRFNVFLGAPLFSWLKVKTAENMESFLGEKIHDLLLAEAPKLPAAAWSKYLTDRIATLEGNVILPATPDGFNWAHDEFYAPAGGATRIGYERSGNAWMDDYWTQSTSALDCPDAYYPAAEKIRMMKRLADNPEDVDRIEQFHGRFAHRSGLVLYRLTGPSIVSRLDARARWGFA
jgi:hypothetical protein